MAQGLGGRCSCGFKAENLIVGALMSGDSYKIVACSECKIIKSIKDNDPSLQICNECNHQMSDIDYHYAGKYKCPSCLKRELYLYPELMAD